MAHLGRVSFDSLFRRCVTGCSTETPPCPACTDDQVCSLVPPSCDSCQKTICVESSTAPASPSSTPKSSNSSPNVGAIAGGIIGGVVFIAIVTYLVWRFCIKTKRQQYEEEDWREFPEESVPAEKDFTMRRDARASTHTVGSIASTVLTRASNIIQIAYIPGVTNRSAPSTPGLLVPPVPPIPIALSSTASTPRYEQEHFFMPGDLRDSTYSGVSDRTSYARTSVASTIYGKNAVVSPVPAQTVIRGKAAVVSVKSNGAGTPGELTPPVPSVDYGKYKVNGPPSPAFSVGSTFLNNANTAAQAKTQVARNSSAQRKDSAQSMGGKIDSPRSQFTCESGAMTFFDDTPTPEDGPFGDPPRDRKGSSSSLSAVIDDAQRQQSRNNTSSPKQRRDKTPFGDENEMRES